jgi:hypothetical protein
VPVLGDSSHNGVVCQQHKDQAYREFIADVFHADGRVLELVTLIEELPDTGVAARMAEVLAGIADHMNGMQLAMTDMYHHDLNGSDEDD